MSVIGFMEGLISLEAELYDKVNCIANNIELTMRTSLEVDSPSKVMYELGAFTMEGFLNGLADLYDYSYMSLSKFSYNTDKLTAAYDGNGINYASHDISKTFNNRNENVYTNEMIPYLAQIAQNTKESAQKEFSIRIGDREIAKANNRGQRSLGRKIMSES